MSEGGSTPRVDLGVAIKFQSVQHPILEDIVAIQCPLLGDKSCRRTLIKDGPVLRMNPKTKRLNPQHLFAFTDCLVLTNPMSTSKSSEKERAPDQDLTSFLTEEVPKPKKENAFKATMQSAANSVRSLAGGNAPDGPVKVQFKWQRTIPHKHLLLCDSPAQVKANVEMFGFQIADEKQVLHFCFDEEEEKMEWMSTIRFVVATFVANQMVMPFRRDTVRLVPSKRHSVAVSSPSASFTQLPGSQKTASHRFGETRQGRRRTLALGLLRRGPMGERAAQIPAVVGPSAAAGKSDGVGGAAVGGRKRGWKSTGDVLVDTARISVPVGMPAAVTAVLRDLRKKSDDDEGGEGGSTEACEMPSRGRASHSQRGSARMRDLSVSVARDRREYLCARAAALLGHSLVRGTLHSIVRENRFDSGGQKEGGEPISNSSRVRLQLPLSSSQQQQQQQDEENRMRLLEDAMNKEELEKRDEWGLGPVHVACLSSATDSLLRLIRFGASVACPPDCRCRTMQADEGEDEASASPPSSPTSPFFPEEQTPIADEGGAKQVASGTSPVKRQGTSDSCMRCAWEDTPLLIAVREGECEIVEILLRHGADPFEISADGWTAVELAALHPFSDVSLSLLRTLRANGVDLNGAPPPPPLDEAEAPTSSPALSAEEDEEGADDVVAPHKRRFPHLNPLQAMIFAGAFPSAWRLLVSGVDPDFPSLCKGPGERERENTRGGDQDFGRPAVHLLCDLGARILDEDLQTGALRLLLKHGATVNLRDRSGKTPLETLKAAVEGQKQRGAEEDPAVLRRLVRLLVEFGARPWECFIPGWQPPTGIHAHLKQFNVTLPQQGAAGAGAVPLSPVMETFRLSMTAAQKGWETRKYALPGAPGVKALEDEWPIPDWGGIRTGHVMQTWTFMSMDSTEGAEVVDWFWGAWVKDAATKACMTCIAPFDAVSRRRHHCRRCGRCVCAACSTKKAPIPLSLVADPAKYDYNNTTKGRNSGLITMMATEHLDSWVGKEKERERGGGILLAHARTGPLGEAKEREKEPLSLSLQPAVLRRTNTTSSAKEAEWRVWVRVCDPCFNFICNWEASGQVVGPHEAAAATGAPVSPKAGPSSEGAVRSAAGEATLDGEEEEEDTDFRTLEMTHRGDLSPRVILSGHPLAAHLFGGEPLNPGKPAELAAVDEGEDEGDEGGSVQGGGGTQQSSTRAGAGGSRPKPKEIMKRFLSNFTASREGRMSRMTSQASMPGTPKSPTPSASASTQRLQIMGGGTAPAGEGQSPGGRNNNGVDPSKRPRCLIGGRQAGGGGGGSPTGGGGASATGPMRVLGGPSTSSRSAMASNAKEEAVQAVAMLQAQKEELDRLQDASSQLEEGASSYLEECKQLVASRRGFF